MGNVSQMTASHVRSDFAPLNVLLCEAALPRRSGRYGSRTGSLSGGRVSYDQAGGAGVDRPSWRWAPRYCWDVGAGTGVSAWSWPFQARAVWAVERTAHLRPSSGPTGEIWGLEAPHGGSNRAPGVWRTVPLRTCFSWAQRRKCPKFWRAAEEKSGGPCVRVRHFSGDPPRRHGELRDPESPRLLPRPDQTGGESTC